MCLRKIGDKGLERWFMALPLSYLACARAGIEPATNVIFPAFAESLKVRADKGLRDISGLAAGDGFEPSGYLM
jgi:hypothetical protein